MGCLRGCGGGGRELLSKALSCVPLVFFWLLFMATTVTAPLVPNVSRSVSSAVQESLLTEEVVALQEIARALKRSVELVTKNWSWIKVSLLGFGGLLVTAIFTGVATLYLVDLGRKKWRHWKSLRPPPLEEVFSLLTRQLSTQLAALGDQLTAAMTIPRVERMLAERVEVERVERERVERERVDSVVENLRSDVANLEAQLNAMRIADAEWKEQKKRDDEFIQEFLRNSEPRPNDGLPDLIEGVYAEAEASRWTDAYLTDS